MAKNVGGIDLPYWKSSFFLEKNLIALLPVLTSFTHCNGEHCSLSGAPSVLEQALKISQNTANPEPFYLFSMGWHALAYVTHLVFHCEQEKKIIDGNNMFIFLALGLQPAASLARLGARPAVTLLTEPVYTNLDSWITAQLSGTRLQPAGCVGTCYFTSSHRRSLQLVLFYHKLDCFSRTAASSYIFLPFCIVISTCLSCFSNIFLFLYAQWDKRKEGNNDKQHSHF